ncbi:lipase 1-like [Leptopilina heterotoma]|uniref:lipase 1-like n=1 Tax=Leptopilina heterotoma TaxID=63436 RepID=UPI001CA9CFBD|nr:lipase 1-like [Leptopilina heterotoma]
MYSSSKRYLCLLLITYNFFTSAKSDSTNVTQKLVDLVSGYGYPFEIHHVETEDGYTLEVHRIPHGKENDDKGSSKSVAFLKHGLVDSSASFMFAGPNVSLAYLLADSGYDVWMSNSRGNVYSRQHKIYSPRKTAFWNFSWHEFGIYDSPAVIDYILNKTSEKKVFHVCVSEGCSELYVMTSLKPEYNEKIHMSVNLAPAVFFRNPSSSAIAAFYTPYMIKEIFSLFGYGRVFDHSPLGAITNVFCQPGKVTHYFCVIMNYLIMGFDWFQTDFDRLSTFLEYYPAGASIKQFIHFGSLIQYSGTFRQFDYGRAKNREVYKSLLPPKYPLEKVTIPVAIFSGLSDPFISVKDVEILSKRLRNLVDRTILENFNHIDVYLHDDIKELVYTKIIKLFKANSTQT